MYDLQATDLSFGYAGSFLFEHISFSLTKGERVALVAPNGVGKSTLLRLLAGELSPEHGEVFRPRGLRFGYYRQSHELPAEGTVLDAFLSGFQQVLTLREELLHAQQAAATGTQAALDRLASLTDRYHLADGDAIERKVTRLAQSLGFADNELVRSVASLSGGERSRLQLGLVLSQDPDLLLLDEPTNHLDLHAIAWLEGHLRTRVSTLLLVSHDRAFLDNVSTKTIELGTKGCRVYPLPYSRYVEAREADLVRERAQVEQQKAMIANTEEFIRKNLAGQKTKQAKSRRIMLDKLERVENPEDIWSAAERIRFAFPSALRSGDRVLEAKRLGATRGGKRLFENVTLEVRRGDRIGIVGPNGAGKSTLLKLLADRGESEDQGYVRRGANLQEGYFDQQLGDLNPENTAVEEIRAVRGDLSLEAARQYLSRFRFWGDTPLQCVRGFSGGERARLALAKLLLEPRNLLFLDEPTNHLDLPAAAILEEALVGFAGTVLLVSHDRRFLENVTTRTVWVEGGKVAVYPGGFRAFLTQTQQGEGSTPTQGTKPRVTTEQGRDAYEVQRQEARIHDRKKKRLQALEQQSAALETEIATLRLLPLDVPESDWEALAKITHREKEITDKLTALFSEWAALTEELA